jgi:2Fe-2S ferredoxin
VLENATKMATITFIEHDGTTHEVEAKLDRTVMQIAVEHAVPGILADCGGSCSCGTCHAYIDAAWCDRLPPVSESEGFMLEAVIERAEGSRLCCQIPMKADLDGMLVRLPVEQL